MNLWDFETRKLSNQQTLKPRNQATKNQTTKKSRNQQHKKTRNQEPPPVPQHTDSHPCTWPPKELAEYVLKCLGGIDLISHFNCQLVFSSPIKMDVPSWRHFGSQNSILPDMSKADQDFQCYINRVAGNPQGTGKLQQQNFWKLLGSISRLLLLLDFRKPSIYPEKQIVSEIGIPKKTINMKNGRQKVVGSVWGILLQLPWAINIFIKT